MNAGSSRPRGPAGGLLLRARETLQGRDLNDIIRLMSGTVGSQIVMVAGLPFLTRLYPPAAFGGFAVVHTLSLILVVFMTFRGEAALNYVKTPAVALLCVKALALIGAAVTVAMLVVVALLAIGPGQLAAGAVGLDAGLLFYMPPLALTFGLSLVLRNWLVRRRRNKAVSIAYALRGPVFIGGSLAAGYAAAGAVGEVGAQILLTSQIAAEAACMLVAFAGLRRSERGYLLRIPVARAFSVFYGVRAAFLSSFWSQVMAQLSDRMPLLVVNAAFGPALAGVFSMSERIVAIPFQLISGSVIDVFNRQAGHAWNTVGRFDQIINTWLKNLVIWSTIPFVILGVLFYLFTGLILGPEWSDAWVTLCILTVWSFSYFNFRVFDRWFVPTGKYALYFLALGSRLLVVAILAGLALAGKIEYTPFVVGFVSISVFVDLAVVLTGRVVSRGEHVGRFPHGGAG